MTEDFKFIDNEDVPPSIKPMTELHDKLVKGYINDKELQLPRLINSLEKRICKQCEEISYLGNNFPEISDNFTKIFSSETAYQIVSMLEGVIKRGTGKKLRKLNLDIAGKTGTTNNNTDAWFIGFTSNLVVGVYVGHDDPKSLGKFETGSKAALPIFELFIKKAINKKQARPFKVPKNIKMQVVELKTGKKVNFGSKKTIIEAFKNDNLEKVNYSDSTNLIYKMSKNNILKFY